MRVVGENALRAKAPLRTAKSVDAEALDQGLFDQAMEALRSDDARVLRLVLSKRPGLANAEGVKHRSLLDEAVILRKLSAAKMLIDFGADASYRDPQGNGALDLLVCALACESGAGMAGRAEQEKAIACAAELIRAGADPSHVDKAGWSALALCARFQLWLMMGALTRLGARPVDPQLLCDQAARALEGVYCASESDALLAAYKAGWRSTQERQSILASLSQSVEGAKKERWL